MNNIIFSSIIDLILNLKIDLTESDIEVIEKLKNTSWNEDLKVIVKRIEDVIDISKAVGEKRKTNGSWKGIYSVAELNKLADIISIYEIHINRFYSTLNSKKQKSFKNISLGNGSYGSQLHTLRSDLDECNMAMTDKDFEENEFIFYNLKDRLQRKELKIHLLDENWIKLKKIEDK